MLDIETNTATAVLQGSPEWHQLRCGRVTASRVADLAAKTKSGYGASRAAYMGQLIAERLTGVVQDGFVSQAMQIGTEREPQARAGYMFRSDALVQEVAFVAHPTIPMCGCSPDGLVGADGLLEIKCPSIHTHIDTLLTGEIDGKYIKQMQFQMAVCNRAWCDYASFHPDLPAQMQLFVKRVPRDDGLIAELETEVREFQRELEARLQKLREKYP
jgi:putative phage-type endonuclease